MTLRSAQGQKCVNQPQKLRSLLVYEENGISHSGRSEKGWTPHKKGQGVFWHLGVSEKDFYLNKKMMPMRRSHVIKQQTQEMIAWHLLGDSN